MAYHAKNRDDLLAGIDEFLDQVTVLPPGEWDPSIRIEPPKQIPSQVSRKNFKGTPPLPNGKMVEFEMEEPGHHDPSLTRTGRYVHNYSTVILCHCTVIIYFCAV